MISRVISIFASLACLVLTSCDVHEFPHEAVPDPEPPVIARTLTLDFSNDEFDHLSTVEVGDESRSRAHADEATHDLHYIVRIYNVESRGATRSLSRAPINYYEGTASDDGSHPSLTIPLELEPGEYELLAWTDHVQAGSTDDLYHNTTDFFELALMGDHSGNNHYREAWRGAVSLLVDEDGHVFVDADHENDAADVVVNMERPLARFHFVTTDLDKFASRVLAKSSEARDGTSVSISDLDDYRIVIRYTGYMPSAYNLYTDKPIDSSTGVSFEGQPRLVGDNYAELGFDYVFVNGVNTSVQVALDLYRASDMELLSTTGTISVPLLRGHYTVITGPLLTTSAGAGLGVNPSYNGEFNIEIH